jgi:hypothetical protein
MKATTQAEKETEIERADVLEKILYALGSRDLTQEEKNHLVTNEKSRKIIWDWSHPNDDPDWTGNNKEWFYEAIEPMYK